MKKIITVFVVASSVVGCTSTQHVNNPDISAFYSGESHADPSLRSDTEKMIKIMVNARGCSKIDHIDTKVLHYEPSNGQKGHVWGQEGWMASGCGTPYPFFVSFTEDGNGGTFFSLKPV